MWLRSVTISALLLALLGFAAFYVLTTPSTLWPVELKPRISSLSNGETLFNIGGCANCHSTPGQGDRLKLGGGLALRSPFAVPPTTFLIAGRQIAKVRGVHDC
jgi:hypothetical protein